ncbi:DUF262 domain-containing protein [Metaclostridioides mangenotii]|uniref:GmrSD restriction endonucleases N-terminal domain-containing protein n=1 Tax=Metaclostridioides mangenotii TaxID=1540 RepID=A0ABS4E6W8_9FIRM|nr:DUF262 domain-containing protein [Clostridioides mangenotii]MBP1853683.1 hypothetical protein [Clostridioides mangenotii]
MLIETPLRKELIEKRKEIQTNQLSMTVGELMNLYEENEINLDPDYQRLFRWDETQQTNFIESILLGYPIPAIFVLQSENGVWDVIDGVQRLSTIYHFVGKLRDKDTNNIIEPLKLKKAKILTNLEGKYYNNDEFNEDNSLDHSSRIDFKRSIISVLIVKDGTSEQSTLELFKRLNTGGSKLSNQEVRNAIILKSNSEVYSKLDQFCKSDKFINFMSLPDSRTELGFDMDIITRFIVMRNYKNIENVKNSDDINSFLDDAIIDIVSKTDYNVENDINVFTKLIDFLSENISEDYGFKLYNESKSKYMYGFNWLVFEIVVWGLTVINNIDDAANNVSIIIPEIQSIKGIGEFLKSKGKPSVVRVIERLKIAKEESEAVFKYE